MSARLSWKSLAAATGVAVALYWLIASVPGSRRVEQPKLAPELALPDLSGKTRRLSELRGKVVLLDFWATWCEPCLEELPELIRLHANLKDRGFTMLGVSVDAEGRETVEPFARDNAIPYPLLLSHGAVPRGFPVPGFPTAFLIDREGWIVRRYLGPKSYNQVAEDVEEYLD